MADGGGKRKEDIGRKAEAGCSHANAELIRSETVRLFNSDRKNIDVA